MEVLEDLREEIIQLLEEVFDKNWETKNCGRFKCQRLLHDLEKMFPGEYFGDKTSGYMHINKIKEFSNLNGLNPYVSPNTEHFWH